MGFKEENGIQRGKWVLNGKIGIKGEYGNRRRKWDSKGKMGFKGDVHKEQRNKTHQANDGSLGIFSTLNTLSTFRTLITLGAFSNVNVGLMILMKAFKENWLRTGHPTQPHI